VKEHTNSSVGIVSQNANLGQNLLGEIEHVYYVLWWAFTGWTTERII